MQFEKKLSDYKQETHITSLHEQLTNLIKERDLLKQQNHELDKVNRTFKSNVFDLEHKLAGYSNTEIIKRVATGVLSGIGSKLLAGSPKAAELLGLTKEELHGALGIVEEEAMAEQNTSNEIGVDVEELSNPKTEQQKQLYKAINDTANALKLGDANFAYYKITIIGNCMDGKDLTKSILQHLKKEKQLLSIADPEKEIIEE